MAVVGRKRTLWDLVGRFWVLGWLGLELLGRNSKAEQWQEQGSAVWAGPRVSPAIWRWLAQIQFVWESVQIANHLTLEWISIPVSHNRNFNIDRIAFEPLHCHLHGILKWCSGCSPYTKHLGVYTYSTLGEILFGEVCELILGRQEKPSFKALVTLTLTIG